MTKIDSTQIGLTQIGLPQIGLTQNGLTQIGLTQIGTINFTTLFNLLSVQPCYMKDWELHVHFKVHGKGSDLYGDGFAVWFTRDRMELGWFMFYS